MLRTLGIVDVGCEESQLPALHRRFGDQTLLQWLVRRATESQKLDAVIVTAAEGAAATFCAGLVPSDIPVFSGHPSDPLRRMCQALEQYRADEVVRLPLDGPFVDPDLIDRLAAAAEQHPGTEYISFTSRRGESLLHATIGPFGEWISTPALRRADRKAKKATDRSTATRYILSHPETFKLRFLPIPAELDREDVRLRISAAEDWDIALEIREALGEDRLDWQDVASLLRNQPNLRERMAVLNRSTSYYNATS